MICKMSIEQQKLQLIEKIASLEDARLVFHLTQLLDEQTHSVQSSKLRKAGFAKGTFPFVADDFDDVLPPGFEDYVSPSTPDPQP